MHIGNFGCFRLIIIVGNQKNILNLRNINSKVIHTSTQTF